MTYQSLNSKWSAAKARRESVSFWTCDREGTRAPDHFQFNPSGRSSFDEFLRKDSLDQYHKGYRGITCSLKFAQTPCGDWQAIPVTQH